jgi:hypothetical protein
MAKPGVGESHVAAGNTGATPSLGTETMSQLDFGPAGVSVFSGTGAPGNLVNGRPPDVGDLFIRKDAGASTYLYRCSVVGPPATWVALAV